MITTYSFEAYIYYDNIPHVKNYNPTQIYRTTTMVTYPSGKSVSIWKENNSLTRKQSVTNYEIELMCFQAYNQ